MYPGMRDVTGTHAHTAQLDEYAQLPARQPAMSDPSADPGGVARQIVRVIGPPQGQRPFRVHVHPRHDDAERSLI